MDSLHNPFEAEDGGSHSPLTMHGNPRVIDAFPKVITNEFTCHDSQHDWKDMRQGARKLQQAEPPSINKAFLDRMSAYLKQNHDEGNRHPCHSAKESGGSNHGVETGINTGTLRRARGEEPRMRIILVQLLSGDTYQSQSGGL